MEYKLFFVLFYFKCYLTFDLAGIFFDFDRSQANRWLHRLQPILETALGEELVLPKRQLKSVAEFITCFLETERVILDGVERPIQRPQDKKGSVAKTQFVAIAGHPTVSPSPVASIS